MPIIKSYDFTGLISVDPWSVVHVTDDTGAFDNMCTLAESSGTRFARYFIDSLANLTTINEAPTPR